MTTYFSNPTKSRQQVLQSLCGLKDLSDLAVIWSADTIGLLEYLNVPQKYQKALAEFVKLGQRASIGELKAWISENLPDLAKQKNVLTRVLDAFALAHYFQRQENQMVCALISDDAPEYKLIALTHALCWIHDVRDYKKLLPQLAINRRALDNFTDQYWKFYAKLLDYQKAKEEEQILQKPVLKAEFERIFQQTTNYSDLDKLISRTYSKKNQMLVVLEKPDMPLHNNASELAARQKVRKRDVSLHTMSALGTMVQDAYLSIVETAKKLEVSVYEYLTDFVSMKPKMVPLHQIITQRSTMGAL